VCGTPDGQIDLNSQADVDAISSCPRLDGQVHVGPRIKQLTFPDGIEAINDGLDANGGDLQSIGATGMTSIGSRTGRRTYSGSLALINLQSLLQISFDSLNDIGKDLVITNNGNVKKITGFPLLKNVAGNIDLTGSFDEISFPSLASVGGNVNIQSSAKNFSCPFPNLKANGVVRGTTFVCEGNIATPRPLSISSSGGIGLQVPGTKFLIFLY
jgi:hypothetical protein